MYNNVSKKLLEEVIQIDHRLERFEWALTEILKILRQPTKELSND